ncbi:MAG TPA: 16S rRNA (guanine(966)-N(2))-methyltransferase RsmD [Segeticoccus sp.]|uniref:16S rRNA (guanine(966)-N(2))-methyltransferase RsmD n=1 Tax=Segeticoccus sp. TaxID=2706531 RepID=UPI002D7FEF09|nr:16S rRNA (guanine(966)-N(2))-methyltransferase RsmD [Segeticoccus sp.]HET8601582.1 16S rRNA (guanine(966)-N(2))-methyltransferase RsmD [Segeticoccus sp.]
MTRIIAGTAGGRRLHTPPGSGTRPTSDRVREAVFSRLEHLDVLSGARVLDLYAGSGALGLEAASRGARRVVLVDASRPVTSIATRNVRELEMGDVVRVVADRAERVLLGGPLDGGEEGRFDLTLIDPPYDVGEAAVGDLLHLLVAHRWLARDAVVVVERSTRSPEPLWPSQLHPLGPRRYGETTVWFAEVPEPDESA